MSLQSAPPTADAGTALTARRTRDPRTAMTSFTLLPPPDAPERNETFERLRRGVREDEQHQALAADQAGQERNGDVIRRSERVADSSSRAFRRELAESRARRSAAKSPDGPQSSSSVGAARAGEASDPNAAARANGRADSPAPLATDASEQTPPGAPVARNGGNPAANPPTSPLRGSDAGGGASSGAPLAASPAPVALAPVPQGRAPSVAARVAVGATGASAATGNAAQAGGVEAARPTPPHGSAALPMRWTAARGAASATSRPTAEPAPMRENVLSMVRVARGMVQEGRTSAVLRLDPPELGMLRLRLDLEKESLTLRIEAQSSAAHELLRSEMKELRRSLEAAGLQVERIEIRGPAPAGDPTPFEAYEREPSERERSDRGSARHDADSTQEVPAGQEGPERADHLGEDGVNVWA